MLWIEIVLAAVTAPPQPAIALLKKHAELRSIESTVAPACDVRSDLTKLAPALEADLDGDGTVDVAIAVRSAVAPVKFGVLALHTGEGRSKGEHWLVPLTPHPVVGIGKWSAPFGVWVIVGTCSTEQALPYLWTGEAYEQTGIY